MTSTPLVNVTPWTTLGNWFSPFSRRHVFAAAMTSFEHHQPGGVLRQRALGPHCAMPNGCEHALDRVRRSQMVPVLGREVVEGQQCAAILDQAGHRLGVFGAILFSERRDCRFGPSHGPAPSRSRADPILAAGWTDLGSLSSTLAVLCTVQR